MTDPFLRALEAPDDRPGPPDDRELAGETRNDIGNARRLRARHGGDLLFVPEFGWIAWDGKRFSKKRGDRIAAMRAQETADAIFAEADALPAFQAAKPDRDDFDTDAAFEAALDEWRDKRGRFESKKRGLRQWAVKSGFSARLSGMLGAAAPHLTCDQDQLDADRYLLNVQNGTLDLSGGAGKTMQLYEHSRRDRITRIAGASYDPAAQAPKWEKFVKEVLPDEEVRGFVQRWLGYNLTGSVSEQKIVYFEGAGANGKSTLLNVVCRVFGDYETTVPVESFLHNERRGGADASPDLAKLVGPRLVRTSEPEVGARLSESRIKQVTGGETITARRLNKDFFEFEAQFKVTLSVNVRPVLRGKDHGIRRRILVVPFLQRFDPAETVPGEEFEDRFNDEMAGILNWLLDGFEQWHADGLRPPQDVRTATEQYFATMDPIGQFIHEATERVDNGRVPANELYAAYQKWCRDYGEECKTQGIFGRRLTDMKLPKEKIGKIQYTGIRILEEFRPSPDDDKPDGPDAPPADAIPDGPGA